jgi:hypothetical protein
MPIYGTAGGRSEISNYAFDSQNNFNFCRFISQKFSNAFLKGIIECRILAYFGEELIDNRMHNS